MKVRAIVLALAATFAASSASAQTPAAKAAPANRTEILACGDANSKAHKANLDRYNAAVKAGNIDAKEAAEFKAFETNAAKHLADMKKDGYTLAECKQRTEDLKKETALVDRISAAAVKAKSAIQACGEANSAAHKANLDKYNAAVKAGKIDAKEAAEFKAFEASAAKHLTDLKKDGYTLAECQQRTEELKKESALIEKISATASKAKSEIMACGEANSAAHKANLDKYNAAVKAGNIDAKEAAEFKTFEANAAKHLADMKKDGYTLAECKQRTDDLKKETALVERISAGAAKAKSEIVACGEANSAAHKANLDKYSAAVKAGNIDAKEAAEFKAFEASAAKHLSDMKKDGYTLAECKQRTDDLKKETELVARISAGAARAKSEIVACGEANAKAHAANLAKYNNAIKAKRISAQEATEFKAFEASAAKHLADMKKDGYTLAECNARKADLVKETALVDRISK